MTYERTFKIIIPVLYLLYYYNLAQPKCYQLRAWLVYICTRYQEYYSKSWPSG